MNNIISANMATIPERIDIALKAVNSIYDQVDQIRIYLNKFDKYPKELIDKKITLMIDKDLRSTGKFYWALEKNQYYFSIDDDLIYPQDYVKEHLEILKKYNDTIAVTLHGKVLNRGPIKSYFKDGIKRNYRCLKDVKRNTYVHILGGGVSAFNTNKILIDRKKFKYLYMDDIEVSMQLQKQNIPIVVRKHKSDYLQYLEPKATTLFEEYMNDDSTHTKMINSIDWKIHKFNHWNYWKNMFQKFNLD